MTGRHSAEMVEQTVAQPAEETAQEAAAEDPAEDDLAERGALRIDKAALRRIVERVADLVPETTTVARTVAGVGAGEHGATARIAIDGEQLDIRLDLALRYPIPVRSTVAAIREQITAELLRVTGQRVRTLDVTVSALLPATQPRVE